MCAMRAESIHQMTEPARHRDAHDTAEARAIMAAGRAFMLTIEANTTTNPRSQAAIRYADIATVYAVASLADTGG
jgi:hypothetical protein